MNKDTIENKIIQLQKFEDEYLSRRNFIASPEHLEEIKKIPKWFVKEMEKQDYVEENIKSPHSLSVYKGTFMKQMAIILLIIEVFATYLISFQNVLFLEKQQTQIITLLVTLFLFIFYLFANNYARKIKDFQVRLISYFAIDSSEYEKFENFNMTEEQVHEIHGLVIDFIVAKTEHLDKDTEVLTEIKKKEEALASELKALEPTRTILSESDMKTLNSAIASKSLLHDATLHTGFNSRNLFTGTDSGIQLLLNYRQEQNHQHISNTPVNTSTIKLKINEEVTEPVFSVLKLGEYSVNPEIILNSDDFIKYFYHSVIYGNTNPEFTNMIEQYLSNNVKE